MKTNQLKKKIQLAEQGDTSMMEELAELYLNGCDGVDINPEQALYWYKKLYEKNPCAAFNIGLFYAKGFGVERDFIKAAEWMEKAAEYGDEDAIGAAKQFRETFEFLKLAEGGDSNAQFRLAQAYEMLSGTLDQAGKDDDLKAAFKWAKRSAAQNNSEGLCILASYYWYGVGVDADLDKAMELYEKAAELGNSQAHWILANWYWSGTGVDADLDKAMELCEKAAELGNSQAQCVLGYYYMNGEYYETNKEKAFELFKKAAEDSSNEDAMYNLGRCYEYGDGVKADLNKAIEWYEKYLEVSDDPDPELVLKLEILKDLPNINKMFGL